MRPRGGDCRDQGGAERLLVLPIGCAHREHALNKAAPAVAGIQVVGQGMLTGGTAGGTDGHDLRHGGHRQEVALVVRMPRLCPFSRGVPPWGSGGRERCRQRIGRRGPGRSLEGQVQMCLQDREPGHEQSDKLAHLRWGRLPGVFAQFRWALRLIHSGSMPDHAVSCNAKRLHTVSPAQPTADLVLSACLPAMDMGPSYCTEEYHCRTTQDIRVVLGCE